MVDYALYMSKRGFPLTRKTLKRIALEIAMQSKSPPLFKKNGPSYKWLRHFLKRHKEISLRKPHALERVRAEVSSEQVEGFFSLLESTLDKLGIKNDPTRIFNLDETGFSSRIQGREKIIVSKGTKHAYQPTVSISGHVTLQLAISAAGQTVAPFIIYSKNLPVSDFMSGLPESWTFSSTDSGFINKHLFLNWFKDHFSRGCGRARPVLVVMDNHVSHLSKEVIDFAQSDNIELLCLPSHSTHLLQPLDVGYYHLLKEHFTSLSVALGYSGMKTIPREKIPKLIHLAMNKISGSSIASAFSCVGICPLNAQKVRINCTTPAEQTTDKEPVIETCHACGQAPNQLVKLGIVPEQLKTILVDPPQNQKPKRKSNRTLDSARVITNVTVQSVEAPTPGPEVMESTPALSVEENVLCEVCMTNRDDLKWIGCDRCVRWVHFECVGREQQRLINRSLKYGTFWFCNACLTEE